MAGGETRATPRSPYATSSFLGRAFVALVETNESREIPLQSLRLEGWFMQGLFWGGGGWSSADVKVRLAQTTVLVFGKVSSSSPGSLLCFECA